MVQIEIKLCGFGGGQEVDELLGCGGLGFAAGIAQADACIQGDGLLDIAAVVGYREHVEILVGIGRLNRGGTPAHSGWRKWSFRRYPQSVGFTSAPLGACPYRRSALCGQGRWISASPSRSGLGYPRHQHLHPALGGLLNLRRMLVQPRAGQQVGTGDFPVLLQKSLVYLGVLAPRVSASLGASPKSSQCSSFLKLFSRASATSCSYSGRTCHRGTGRDILVSWVSAASK